MPIINADRVSFAAALSGEVRPEIGSGSEPTPEAAMSSVYTMTAGNGGGSGREGNGSSDRMAGCPGAGGRRETDAVRVVLLELDTSLGLRSRPRKGVPPRPRPRPPRPPPPRRGRETTIFLRDRSNACTECVWRVEVSPLLSLTEERFTEHFRHYKKISDPLTYVGTLQRHYKKISDPLEEISDLFGRISLPEGQKSFCSAFVVFLRT